MTKKLRLITTNCGYTSLLPQLILLYSFFFLCPVLTQAQTYNWKWAIKGGGTSGGFGAETSDEQIYDIKVGSDNNYYFIASITSQTNTNLNNQPVTVYNRSSNEQRDIFLFSTTCEGEVRWSQAIGGGSDDSAYTLVLDKQNNVYIGANVQNAYTTPDGHPVHFSSTDFIPNPTPIPEDPYNLIPQEGYKSVFLIKYSSTGQYLGKKALQGNVGLSDGMYGLILNLVMDSNNKLHFIVGLAKGRHLDNQVTVPNQYGWDPIANRGSLQFHVVQYDVNLNYSSSMILPVSGDTAFFTDSSYFAYDEVKRMYYLAGERMGAPLSPVVYKGKPIINKSYLLAIDATTGNERWRRELYSDPVGNQLPYNTINSLVVDTDSSVYIGGYVWKSHNDRSLKIYDPNNAAIQPYFITTAVDTNFPMVAKFTSEGVIQWVKVPTAFAANYSTNTALRPKGLAINGNEIAFASGESYFKWDEFTQNNPEYHQPDPTLLRFDKQTGKTLGMHTISGDPRTRQFMKAVAADKDGNYITGGTFAVSLFINNTTEINRLVSTGQTDFFIAKLENNPCGSGNLSTENFTVKQFILYPNPTTDYVYINTDENLTKYTVYDATGKEVQQGTFEEQYMINLQSLHKGLYYIQISTAKGNTETSKILKQ